MKDDGCIRIIHLNSKNLLGGNISTFGNCFNFSGIITIILLDLTKITLSIYVYTLCVCVLDAKDDNECAYVPMNGNGRHEEDRFDEVYRYITRCNREFVSLIIDHGRDQLYAHSLAIYNAGYLAIRGLLLLSKVLQLLLLL
jgi:hypothetical protein